MITNPLKALFFAVENPEHDCFDEVVYGFEPYMGWFTSTTDALKGDDDLICFYPKHINPRIVSQEACFVAFKFPKELQPFAPLTVYNDNTEDPNAWLEQIDIPKAAKPQLDR